jgi:HPt (histidine-containing phosphotransfer) domain-containing protein
MPEPASMKDIRTAARRAPLAAALHAPASGAGKAADAVIAMLERLPDGARTHVASLYRETLAVQVPLLAAALAGAAHSGGQEPQALAHKLAGSAAMMQDAPVSQLARAMEQALRAGHAQAAIAMLTRLEDCAARTLAVLNANGDGSSAQ